MWVKAGLTKSGELCLNYDLLWQKSNLHQYLDVLQLAACAYVPLKRRIMTLSGEMMRGAAAVRYGAWSAHTSQAPSDGH